MQREGVESHYGRTIPFSTLASTHWNLFQVSLKKTTTIVRPCICAMDVCTNVCDSQSIYVGNIISTWSEAVGCPAFLNLRLLTQLFIWVEPLVKWWLTKEDNCYKYEKKRGRVRQFVTTRWQKGLRVVVTRCHSNKKKKASELPVCSHRLYWEASGHDANRITQPFAATHEHWVQFTSDKAL